MNPNKQIHFTIPEEVANAAETIFTVSTRRNGRYGIWISKTNSPDIIVKSLKTHIVTWEFFLTDALQTNFSLYSEKALAIEIAYLLFNEETWIHR
jgi:hypothetical protein